MRGVSLTHPVLASFFLFGEFLLYIPCWLYFSVGAFSYISHACFIFLGEVSLTHSPPPPPWGVSLTISVLALFLCGEFLLHIPCWLYFYLLSFSDTSYACFLLLLFMWRVSLTHPMLALSLSLSLSLSVSLMWGVSLRHPMLALFLSGEFRLHIPCWLHFYLGSFSYTSHAGFIFIWGVSLTHPVLSSVLCQEFLLHITCWLFFLNFIWGVSLTHPMLVLLFIGGVSLTHLMRASFCLGSFSYTSHAGFIFILGVSFTHPMLTSFLCWEFLLHIPCWLFSPSLSGEFLLHIPCWLYFSVGIFITHPTLA